LEQLNRKTEEEKRMQPFTTNWYLYKTYLYPISAKPQKINTTTNSHEPQKRENQKNNIKKTVKFEDLLLEAIDEGLSLLGESSKQVVYFHLEKTFKMNRQDIPYKIEDFNDAIESIFGTGAKILQIQMMKCLFKKVGYKLKNYSGQKSLEFTEYVEAIKIAKKKYENSKEQQLN
jgi:hypothetical protein